MAIKTAYELGLERIIASRYANKKEKNSITKTWDFVKIDEFSDREDKVLESNETKLIDGSEKKEDIKNNIETIKVMNPETINFSDIIECYFVGSTKSYSGYSKMNRNLVFGLSDRNVKIKLEDVSDSIDINKETHNQIKFLEGTEISSSSPKIYSMTVPMNVTHEGKKISYTMIESSSLHKDYCEKLNLVDEIWVPSNFERQLMKNYNIHPPVYVMPLGVDVSRYKPGCGTINFGSAVRKFKFLCLSKYSFRKGFDIVIKAFLEEFSNKDDVSLILVSSPWNVGAEKRDIHALIHDFQNIKSTIKKTEEDLPHVALWSKPIAEKDVPKIYNSCDAFVLISRGEGFSLTVVEAASCGLPVIASNVTAHMDFLNQDNSFLVEPEGFVKAETCGQLSEIAKLCHFYEGQMFPVFSSHAIEQTKFHMRFIYENYQKAKEKAQKLRSLIINNYCWDMSIDKVYNRLREQ